MLKTLVFISLTVALTLAGHIEEEYPSGPQAYKFGYDIKDGHGNSQMRHEESDDWGNKKGSYGYTDAWGIYRIVDYVADKGGYRAWIRTNEPGTSNQDPASVKIQSEHSPIGATYKAAAPVFESFREPAYVQPEAVYSKAVVAPSPVQYEEPVYKRGYPVEEVYETKPKAFVYAPKRAGVRRIRKMKRISKPEYLPSYARANLASYGGFGTKISKPITASGNEELPLYKDKK